MAEWTSKELTELGLVFFEPNLALTISQRAQYHPIEIFKASNFQ